MSPGLGPGVPLVPYKPQLCSEYDVYPKTISGKYSRLSVEFFVRRDASKFVHSIALPAAIVMLVSWLAFWLDPADESGCRALTILFTVLALLALYSRASSQLV